MANVLKLVEVIHRNSPQRTVPRTASSLSALAALDNEQQLPSLDRHVCRYLEVSDLPASGGANLCLHFHRLEDQQGLSFLHRLARLHQHLEHTTRHGSGDRLSPAS